MESSVALDLARYHVEEEYGPPRGDDLEPCAVEQRERQQRCDGEKQHQQGERRHGEFSEGDEVADLAGAEEQPEQR